MCIRDSLHDIREYRRWHREAAIRGKRAGMDIIYVYAGHDLSLAMHFLQRRRNQRCDEYGGSLENRVRLLREAEWADAGIQSIRCIGDALAPGLIVHAVYEGHRYARELEEAAGAEVPFKRHFHHSPDH